MKTYASFIVAGDTNTPPPIKAASSSEMVSACYDSRGGTNITRTAMMLHYTASPVSRILIQAVYVLTRL
jgi:hypothetical protein